MTILGFFAWLIYSSAMIVGTAFVVRFVHEAFHFPWWFAYLAAINFTTFGLFAWDWLIAPLSNIPVLGWILLRVPNWMLFGLLPAVGGFAGVVGGVGILGHKSSDQYFVMRNWAFGIALLTAMITVLLWRAGSITAETVDATIQAYAIEVTESATALAGRLAAGGLLRG